MGLMQLLAVGRSLGKIGDQPSRYKMMQQSLLPRFGSVKAPEERVPGAGEVGNQVIANSELKQSSLRFAAAANDRKTMNAVQPKPLEVTVPKITTPRAAFPLGRWTLFRNPFSKTPKAKPAEATVQPELLSLDEVKPVRNDLSDADLELVQSAKCAPGKCAPAMVQPEPVAVAPDGVAWSRIKTQFFGAGKA
jgi:hypothetical protein